MSLSKLLYTYLSSEMMDNNIQIKCPIARAGEIGVAGVVVCAHKLCEDMKNCKRFSHLVFF